MNILKKHHLKERLTLTMYLYHQKDQSNLKVLKARIKKIDIFNKIVYKTNTFHNLLFLFFSIDITN